MVMMVMMVIWACKRLDVRCDVNESKVQSSFIRHDSLRRKKRSPSSAISVFSTLDAVTHRTCSFRFDHIKNSKTRTTAEIGQKQKKKNFGPDFCCSSFHCAHGECGDNHNSSKSSYFGITVGWADDAIWSSSFHCPSSFRFVFVIVVAGLKRTCIHFPFFASQIIYFAWIHVFGD